MNALITHKTEVTVTTYEELQGLARQVCACAMSILENVVRTKMAHHVRVERCQELTQLLDQLGVDYVRDLEYEELEPRAPERSYKISVALTQRTSWHELDIREGLCLVAKLPEILPEGMALQLGRSVHYVSLSDCCPRRYPHVAFLGRENGKFYLRYACRVHAPTSHILIPTKSP